MAHEKVCHVCKIRLRQWQPESASDASQLVCHSPEAIRPKRGFDPPQPWQVLQGRLRKNNASVFVEVIVQHLTRALRLACILRAYLRREAVRVRLLWEKSDEKTKPVIVRARTFSFDLSDWCETVLFCVAQTVLKMASVLTDGVCPESFRF